MVKYFAVYITTGSVKEARNISSALLKERLVACANIIPGVESHYWWKGNITKSKEVLLICKTRSGLEKKIIAMIKKNHSYDVPCVTFLPIENGNPDFLSWINKETHQ